MAAVGVMSEEVSCCPRDRNETLFLNNLKRPFSFQPIVAQLEMSK